MSSEEARAVSIRRYLLNSLAVCLFALGNLLFAVPNTIMNGGVTGIAQITYYVGGWNIGLSILLLNLPIFLFAFLFYRHLFYNSLFSMVLLALVIGLLQTPLQKYGIHHMWIGSIGGGLVMGISLGILSRLNSSLGGGTLLGKMLHHRFHFPLSWAVFFIDISVYPISFFLIGAKETLFSFLLTACSAWGISLFGSKVKKVSNLSSQPVDGSVG